MFTAADLLRNYGPNGGFPWGTTGQSLATVPLLLQGAGAAAVPTLGVALLSGRYDGAERGLALGRLAGMAAFVSCLGPFLGGLVEHALGWRAVMAMPILGLLVLPVERTLA